MKIPFAKAHGTGNDFVIFLTDRCPDLIREAKFIEKICARRTGVGADAVLILSDIPNFDFQMDYYNSDGGWETMCANGARCAALYMFNQKRTGKKIDILAGDGTHKAEIIHNRQVRLQMTVPKYLTDEITVGGYSGFHIDSGASHFVTEVKNFPGSEVAIEARKIRYDEFFAPRGVNVNFFEPMDNSSLKVLTYEKGVEKFMLSCGTGSVAAVFHAVHSTKKESPMTVQVPGGKLIVEFDENWQNVWLSGPAVILYESIIDTDDLDG